MLYRTRYQLNKVMLEYKKRKKKNWASIVDAGNKNINIWCWEEKNQHLW